MAVLLKNSGENRFSWVRGLIALGILIVTAYFALPDLQIERREIPEGEVEEYEGQYDIYGTMLCFVDKNGKV